ncbi:hypothetical protein Pnap_2294 [Polaromonas naphthalenivorans CJ2]|uniref:Lipoprotein n=1 Tax=Polaromonas naphthalenivorans (strain CJ2) TaxID=365044 RepID=A1VPM4_POLNA|nr:hypothetical protein Pnap_2294 [Polaromonas naphthalenivorans CJ2]
MTAFMRNLTPESLGAIFSIAACAVGYCAEGLFCIEVCKGWAIFSYSAVCACLTDAALHRDDHGARAEIQARNLKEPPYGKYGR